MTCLHSFPESEAAVATEGLCPLCLGAEVGRLRAKLQHIAHVCEDNAGDGCNHKMALNFICLIVDLTLKRGDFAERDLTKMEAGNG